MTITIAVFIHLPPVVRAALEGDGHSLVCLDDLGSRAAVVEYGAAARIVITNGEGGLKASELALLPNVELICAIGVGFEGIDLDAAAARGIVVSNGRGTNDTAVADHTLGLMLAVAGGIVPADGMVRAGDWRLFASGGAGYPFLIRRRGLFGKRLGIVGLGSIGSKIADRGHHGFEMPVSYHGRRFKPESPYRFMQSVRDLAAWSDFLVVSAPGGAGTRHLVDAAVLNALGPEGFLINIGRGSIVDTAALISALGTGGILGAGLDVVEGEPVVPPELLALGNVVLSPHMAGRGPEPVQVMAGLLMDNIRAFLASEPLLTPIDMDRAD